MDRNNSGIILIAAYLLTALYLTPFYPDKGPDFQSVNWAAAVSLVERTTFDLSETEKAAGLELREVRRAKNGVYPDRQPGLTVISAPIYAIARIFLGEGKAENMAVGVYVLRLALATIPLLLLAGWLYSSEVDPFSLAILLFATPLLPYSLLFGSELIVAILVYLAFRVIYDFPQIMPGRCFTAGGFLGVALSCSVWTAVPIAAFGLGLLFTDRRDRGRRILFYTAAIVPFAAALAGYHYLVYGSFVEVFSEFQFAVPDLGSVYAQWISPASGIFAFAPVLLLALVSLFTSREAGTLRFNVKYFSVALMFAAALFFHRFDGYILSVPALLFVTPLLLDSFFDGDTDDYPSPLRGFLVSVSMLMCLIPSALFAFAPSSLAYPHNSFWRPLMLNDSFQPSNLWEWFAPGAGSLTLLPVAALALIVLYAVWRAARYPVRFSAGMLAGVLLVTNYMFVTNLEPGISVDEIQKVLSGEQEPASGER